MTHVTVGRWFVILTLVLLCVISFVGGVGLILTSHGTATSHDVVLQGQHRDCITTIATARNAVFQNVDIYKAIQIEQLSSALLLSQSGTKATPETIKAFADNDAKLRESLVEAKRLQPPETLNRLIAHGGMVDGVRYPACP